MEVTIWQVLQVLVVPAFGYVMYQMDQFGKKIEKLNDKIEKNARESIKADENTNKHILGCVNYKLKDGAEALVNS